MVTLSFVSKSSSLLEALRNGKDCPVCLLCEEDLRSFYTWYFNEYYNDPVWILKILDSRGFCNKHSWDLICMGNDHHMSLVYEHLVKSTLVKLERLSKELKKFELRSRVKKIINKKHLQEITKQLQPDEVCPICRTIFDKTAIWIENLLANLNDDEINELYLMSYGLCINHFSQAFKSASPEVAELLIQKQVEVLRKLDSDLEECSRKLDYRYSHEPKGEEQTAWIRAIKFFVGKEL